MSTGEKKLTSQFSTAKVLIQSVNSLLITDVANFYNCL